MITFTNLGQQGRIANQLFQLSATIALAMRNNDSYIFPSWQYENDFNLHNCFSNSIVPSVKYLEPFFQYQAIPHNNTNSQVLDLSGFFQSEKYFEDYKEVIIRLLTPKIGYGIKWNHTAVHVRRGDYLQLSDYYHQLDLVNYYTKAMNIIKTDYYYIFSDDIAWCKQNFRGTQFLFSEGQSPVTDLSLFSSCEHSIIANSSFSWWGAYLNKNPSKMIIAPKNWFGPKLAHNTKDLLPNNWIKINV